MSAMILIDHSVVNRIQTAAKEHHPLESGGLLLGLRRGSHLHILRSTKPFPRDSASRTRFKRKDPRHQRVAKRLWTASKGFIDWLGEWHSHPGGSTFPSSIDVTTWRRQTNQNQIAMAFLIVNDIGLQVFRTAPETTNLEPYMPREQSPSGVLYARSYSGFRVGSSVFAR